MVNGEFTRFWRRYYTGNSGLFLSQEFVRRLPHGNQCCAVPVAPPTHCCTLLSTATRAMRMRALALAWIVASLVPGTSVKSTSLLLEQVQQQQQQQRQRRGWVHRWWRPATSSGYLLSRQQQWWWRRRHTRTRTGIPALFTFYWYVDVHMSILVAGHAVVVRTVIMRKFAPGCDRYLNVSTLCFLSHPGAMSPMGANLPMGVRKYN